MKKITLILLACGTTLCLATAHDHHHADGEPCPSQKFPTPLLPLMQSPLPSSLLPMKPAPAPAVAASLTVPQKNQDLLALSFVDAAKRPVRDTVRIPGRFELMPGARAVYAAPVRGRVTLNVRPPQKVNAGDVLFTLESPDWLQEKNALAMLEADAKAADARLGLLRNRLAALKEAGRRDAALELESADMQAALDRTTLELEGLRAVVDMTRAQFSEDNGVLSVRAKTGGTVHTLATETGSWPDAGGEVLAVMETSRTWFRADANTREAATLHDGQKAFVEPARGTAPHTAPLDARLEIGLPDPLAPRTTPVFAVVANLPEWARPGRAGTLCAVAGESAPAAVALPEACLVEDGLKTYAIVRDATDATRFHKREVERGTSDGVWTEVRGINAGETAVADGVYELNLAMPVSGGATKPVAGHFHADGKFHEGSH